MAEKVTPQMDAWLSDFGAEYTRRNPQTVDEMNRAYQDEFGVTRSQLNEDFLGFLSRDAKILEVGANVAVQLEALQRLGFRNLYGIELQGSAVEVARKRTTGINIIQGNALAIPFRDGFFDLVYTSGVLIHISPADLPTVFDGIYRCSSRYVWGFEYYDKEYREIPYRGRKDLLWKGDFSMLYRSRFPDLAVVKSRLLNDIGEHAGNVDCMYLLEKSGRK